MTTRMLAVCVLLSFSLLPSIPAAEPAFVGGLSIAPVGFGYYAGSNIRGLSDAKVEHQVVSPNTGAAFVDLLLGRYFGLAARAEFRVPSPPNVGWIMHARLLVAPMLNLPFSQRVKLALGPEAGVSMIAFRAGRHATIPEFGDFWNASSPDVDNYFGLGLALGARAEVIVSGRRRDGWSWSLGYAVLLDQSRSTSSSEAQFFALSIGELAIGLRRAF